MANINKIRLSGQTYNIEDVNATKTVELTQAQYDALTVKDPNTFYVITDAQGADLTAIENRLSEDEEVTAAGLNVLNESKQDTLVSGTNIKTINNESILGSGNIDIQGGGSSYTAGRGIDITNDIISFSLPISAGTGLVSIIEGYNTTASAIYSHAEGYNTTARGNASHAEGIDTIASGARSHAEGQNTQANGNRSHAEGFSTQANNQSEHASGQYNVSSSASTEFGDSGNTLFSVGNGTSTSARHNAFEIRQNGDIYLTKNGQDVKLQDQLGGGGTVESAITSGSTNAVESKAIWSATTFNKGILLTFNENNSTNYPEGCGKLMVDVGDYGSTTIAFKNNKGLHLGRIEIQNFGDISVDTSEFGGATYEISGTTVILSYPSTGITSVQTYQPYLTYTAVVEGAWVNENTYMKSEVDAIASGLQNNINSKLDATAYTPTVVDSALNVASTNPIQNQALYSELRIDNGETETTLTFENGRSTNYPNGCTKLIVELVGSGNSSDINFYNDGDTLGYITIMNYGMINVGVAFDGATYEISGTTVIINYPTVTNVTRISVTNGNYVYKAIVALATPLKNQVVANTTALSSVEDRLAEDEEVTARALIDVNDNFGGLKLMKISQTDYDNLQVKDQNVLYIIVS